MRWILQLAAMTLSIASQASPNSFIVFPYRRRRSNDLMASFISHQISLNLRCLNLMVLIERVEVTTLLLLSAPIWNYIFTKRLHVVFSFSFFLQSIKVLLSNNFFFFSASPCGIEFLGWCVFGCFASDGMMTVRVFCKVSIINIEYHKDRLWLKYHGWQRERVTGTDCHRAGKSLTQFLRMKKRKSIAMSSSTFGGRKRHDKLCFCSISGDAVLKLNEHENTFCVMPE